MIELINSKGCESISKPSVEFLQILKRKLDSTTSPLDVAEIGVGIGATSLEIVRLMNGRGRLHLYDFEDKVDALKKDLDNVPFTNGLIIEAVGNSRKRYDSYAWNLAKLLQSMPGDPSGVFDVVYLDGAHTFHHDAAACAVLKELVRAEGYLVFDDMYWSFVRSPTINPTNYPAIKGDYTEEQLEQPHIEVVVDCLIRTDSRFKQVFLSENKLPYRPIFQKT